MNHTVIGKDGREYAAVSCDHCGLVMPRYEAIEWTEKVEVGGRIVGVNSLFLVTPKRIFSPPKLLVVLRP